MSTFPAFTSMHYVPRCLSSDTSAVTGMPYAVVSPSTFWHFYWRARSLTLTISGGANYNFVNHYNPGFKDGDYPINFEGMVLDLPNVASEERTIEFGRSAAGVLGTYSNSPGVSYKLPPDRVCGIDVIASGYNYVVGGQCSAYADVNQVTLKFLVYPRLVGGELRLYYNLDCRVIKPDEGTVGWYAYELRSNPDSWTTPRESGSFNLLGATFQYQVILPEDTDTAFSTRTYTVESHSITASVDYYD